LRSKEPKASPAAVAADTVVPSSMPGPLTAASRKPTPTEATSSSSTIKTSEVLRSRAR
jgi:hypothetical protein